VLDSPVSPLLPGTGRKGAIPNLPWQEVHGPVLHWDSILEEEREGQITT